MCTEETQSLGQGVFGGILGSVLDTEGVFHWSKVIYCGKILFNGGKVDLIYSRRMIIF